MKGSELYGHGPSWLLQDSQFWSTWKFPEIDLEKKYTETTEESKAVVFKIVGISQEIYEMVTPFGIDELQSLTKLLNVTSNVQRIVSKIKKKQSSFGNLKQDKIPKAENLSIKYVQ